MRRTGPDDVRRAACRSSPRARVSRRSDRPHADPRRCWFADADRATLPRPISERRERDWDFPQALDREQLDPVIRRAIMVDARMKPDYARVRVPVLAIYQAQRPLEEVAAGYTIRNDQERAALRQEYAATRALYTRWQRGSPRGCPDGSNRGTDRRESVHVSVKRG